MQKISKMSRIAIITGANKECLTIFTDSSNDLKVDGRKYEVGPKVDGQTGRPFSSFQDDSERSCELK